jgi:hypothetical protein
LEANFLQQQERFDDFIRITASGRIRARRSVRLRKKLLREADRRRDS